MFPVLGRKIKPKEGSIVIFPSFYTHAHLGAIALSSDRYIVASHITWKTPTIKENKNG